MRSAEIPFHLVPRILAMSVILASGFSAFTCKGGVLLVAERALLVEQLAAAGAAAFLLLWSPPSRAWRCSKG